MLIFQACCFFFWFFSFEIYCAKINLLSATAEKEEVQREQKQHNYNIKFNQRFILFLCFAAPVCKGILVEMLLSVASNVRSKWERSTIHHHPFPTLFRHSRISLNVFNSTRKAKKRSWIRELWIHFLLFLKIISIFLR